MTSIVAAGLSLTAHLIMRPSVRAPAVKQHYPTDNLRRICGGVQWCRGPDASLHKAFFRPDAVAEPFGGFNQADNRSVRFSGIVFENP
jgi:hypothetical protein